MIGPCLVLLLGGAPPSPPARPALEPAELRLYHAVVVPEDALEGADLPDDLDPLEDPSAPEESGMAPVGHGGDVPLRKAAVLRAPDPIKEP